MLVKALPRIMEKQIKRIEKKVQRLLLLPLDFYDVFALNPIDIDKLEILLLSMGMKTDRLREKNEEQRRRIFDMAVQLRDLRNRWQQEVSTRFPKFGKQNGNARKMENAVSTLASDIRKLL